MKKIRVPLSVIWLILAVLFNAYFVALNVASPGTIAGTFFSFSAVWFWLSVGCALLFVLEKLHLWKNASRKTKGCIIGILFFGTLVALINLILITHPRLADGTEDVKYVIVLGGGITKDATLTDSVQKRIEHAAEYLKRHPDAIAVVTGGKGPFAPCPESDVLKPALCALGIDESRVLAEDKAKDTIQNFSNSANLLAEHQNLPLSDILSSPVTIITSDFHLARAERLARRMGFSDIYGSASRTPLLFVPNCYAREICAYIKLNLRIFLTGKPAVLISR